MLKRALNNTVTVDPGYDTGIAHWIGDYYPDTCVLSTRREGTTIERLYDISLQWKDYLHIVKPSLVVLEGVCLWGGSAVSQAGAAQGYTFDLSYLVGSMITRAKDEGAEVKLVYVTDTKINGITHKGWKGQLDSKALQKRIARVNGVEKYPQHVQEAVGIGFSEMGIL